MSQTLQPPKVHSIEPHGGELIHLLAEPSEVAEWQEKAQGLPRHNLSQRELCDLEMLSIGAFKAEFNERHHDRGVISMARSSNPDCAGSQFFICHGNPRNLDRQYTAFGKLIKGDDVLEKIATTPTHRPDRPDKRTGIESIKIVPADSVK